MIDYREQYLKSPAAQQQYGVTPGIAALGRRSQLQSPQTSTGIKGGVGVAPPPQINPITGQAFSAVNLSPQQAGSLLGSKGGAASSAPVIASEPSKLTEAESEELAEVGIDVPSSLIEAASQVTAPVATPPPVAAPVVAPQTGMSAQPDIVQAAVASQLAPGSSDTKPVEQVLKIEDRPPSQPPPVIEKPTIIFTPRPPTREDVVMPPPPPPVDRLEPEAIRQTIEASVSEPAPLPPPVVAPPVVAPPVGIESLLSRGTGREIDIPLPPPPPPPPDVRIDTEFLFGGREPSGITPQPLPTPAQPPTLPPFSSPKLSKGFTDKLRDQLSSPTPPPPPPLPVPPVVSPPIVAEPLPLPVPLPPPPPPPPVPPPMMTPADLREAAVPMAMPVPDIVRAAATPITQPIGFDVAPPPVAPLPPPMLPVAPAPVSAGSMAGSKGGAEPQLADASFVGITPPANIPALPPVAPVLLPKTPRRRIEAVADPRLPRFIPPPGI